MNVTDTTNHGRKAFRDQSWAAAYTHLTEADSDNPLAPEDLERLARAAYLIGKVSESIDIWTRAHQAFLDRDNIQSAVCCAFWLGMILMNQGQGAQAGGWMSRAGRLMEHFDRETAESGLLLVPKGLESMHRGDAASAHDLFTRAAELGIRSDNPDLKTLGLLGRGQALIRMNRIAEGTTLLDEAMVAVVSDDVSPIVVGLVYCAVIETCQKIYDLDRAREWTDALSRWCDSHPDLVPYRGQCLVRRAEILQLHGDWVNALTEARHACDLLSKPPGEPAAGEAFYRLAEMYRLQGKFSEAMEFFGQASRWGRVPQPGLALMKLSQGKIDVAAAAIRQLENEKKDAISRSKILPAYVRIMLSAGEIAAARKAANELSVIASDFHSNYLQAVSDYGQGCILLSTGDPHAALEQFRSAGALFHRTEAVYESAQTRILLGRSCKEIGDTDGAIMEFKVARDIFRQLEALPDLQETDELIRSLQSDDTHGLTPREQEVLQLLATGKTNRDIAALLCISERTVDRHVSNIYSKLNLPSRAAATAYAFQNNLI